MRTQRGKAPALDSKPARKTGEGYGRPSKALQRDAAVADRSRVSKLGSRGKKDVARQRFGYRAYGSRSSIEQSR
jgi:hypothetical protein